MDTERPTQNRRRRVLVALGVVLALVAAREIAFRRNRLHVGPPEARRRPAG